ncbi:MAG: formylglycine-generating enzyme family protein [Magnetococcales bacterium]|nr:formylglycine-generating enzyme family protein [Magnetococcales bacterium]
MSFYHKVEASQKTHRSIKKIDDLVFVQIPAGDFVKGCRGNLDSNSNTYCIVDEKPVEKIKMPKSFYMSATEITQGQWQKIMRNNPSVFSKCGPDCPVENVTWEEVQTFISKLNASGKAHYRLPTNSEWEYAARAGTTTAWSHGDNNEKLDDYAWSVHNAGSSTHTVASKNSNPWGLYDMHGNVSEMTHEMRTIIKNVSMDTGKKIVVKGRTARGGNWENTSNDLRSSSLITLNTNARRRNIGFRLVKIE